MQARIIARLGPKAIPLWQAEGIIPPYRNPIRKDVTQLPVDDQTGLRQAVDRVL
jgi:hypothetical protein